MGCSFYLIQHPLICYELGGLARQPNTQAHGKTHIGVYFILWFALGYLLKHAVYYQVNHACMVPVWKRSFTVLTSDICLDIP